MKRDGIASDHLQMQAAAMPQDGFYLPMGTTHAYHNITDKPVTLIFGVAPTYFEQPDL